MKTLKRNPYTPAALTLALAVQPLPAQAQAEAGANAGAIAVVEVAGRGASGAYYANDARGAKTDLPMRELPQAVRVMSRQSLDDLGALRLDDALDYVGGVSRQNSFGGLWDNIAIRGLAGDPNNGMALLQNGFSANRGGINAPRDTANVERIEFLKGPAAALYGASEPGGTLNIVNKRPLWRAMHAAEAQGGTDDFQRMAVDSTGPLGGQLAYRLNAVAEHRGSFRDVGATRRTMLAPAFTWRAGPETVLDYRGEVLRHRAPLDRGMVAIGGSFGAVPRERFLGEPGDGDVAIVNQSHQLSADHALGAGWNLRAALSYRHASLRGFSTEPAAALQADQRTLQRQRRYRDYGTDDVALQAEISGVVRTGPLAHDLLAGVEAFRFDYDQRLLRFNPGPAMPYAIDVLAPVYGQPLPQPPLSAHTQEDQENRAWYVQDAVRLGGHWRLLAGVRVDRYRQSLLNLRNGANTLQQPHATSPRLGVSWLPLPQWSLFANMGRSFRPNTGADARGAAFAPERGRAAELGAKWESADGRRGATVAFYDIRKRNALTSDPAQPGYSLAAGIVRSRGMDADYSGSIGRAWRANASLSYIDADVVRDNALATGVGLINVPRVNGSLLVMHDAGPLSIGGGVTFSAKRPGEARTQAQERAGAGRFHLPAYGVARFAAHWRISPRLRLSLEADNLFDRHYYASSYQRTWVSPGAARSVAVGLQTTL
jgi:iron complex outermembrane receptor protein